MDSPERALGHPPNCSLPVQRWSRWAGFVVWRPSAGGVDLGLCDPRVDVFDRIENAPANLERLRSLAGNMAPIPDGLDRCADQLCNLGGDEVLRHLGFLV